VSGLVLEEVVAVVVVVVVVVVVEDDSDTSPSPSESEPVADLSPAAGGNLTTPPSASEVIDRADAPPTVITDPLFFFFFLVGHLGSGTLAAEVPSDFVSRFVLVFATGVEPMIPSPLIAAVVVAGNVGEEEPFFLRLFFFTADVRGAPPCICSSGTLGSGGGGTGTDAFRSPEWRPLAFFFAGAVPVDVDVGSMSARTRRGCGATLSERAANLSTTELAAVGDPATFRSVVVDVADAAAAVLVLIRGTSTKSAVSDRGELGGEGEENAAEDDKDQTISSSSEGESLAHLVLEVRESMSIEDDKEVVMASYKEVYFKGGGTNA
jgi:hypothetical protein